jgi:hypothetical protein
MLPAGALRVVGGLGKGKSLSGSIQVLNRKLHP